VHDIFEHSAELSAAPAVRDLQIWLRTTAPSVQNSQDLLRELDWFVVNMGWPTEYDPVLDAHIVRIARKE